MAHTLHDAYSFIKSLQHRGREATGIAAIANNRIDVIKWEGQVDKFDIIDLHKIFQNHDYHTYMAHVRYATRGRKDKILEDAHPHIIGGNIEDRGSHILITDCEIVGVHNGQVGDNYFDGTNENLKTGCDTEKMLHFYKQNGEYELIKKIPGAYTIAIADKKRNEVIVLRDRTGIKPGVLGWKDGKYCISSEDIAFKKNGAEPIEDLEPGCIYYITANGSYRKEKVVEKEVNNCFFEWNYIAERSSILNGVSVNRLRELLGEILAEEFKPKDIDLVTFLPRCPEVAARSYAIKRNLPFAPIFYKMRGERSFQGSTLADRKVSIQENLHLLPYIKDSLKGKTIVVIDDSVVRGNNSKRARDLLYDEAEVKKAYLANYTPPIGIIGKDSIARGCLFGVDMPPDDSFIARGRTIEQIGNEIGMPVVYLSVEGMLKAFEMLGINRKNLCTYCIGGKHPFKH